MECIKIVICDDHPLITQGLQSAMGNKSNMNIVATANSGEELKKVLSQTETEVLLLDINLPDASGIDLCSEIKKHYPQTKIIALSNHNERSVILRMLAKKASGYLVKSASITEIENAIKEVHSGGIYFGAEAKNILASLAGDVMEVIPPITKREKEVLKLIAEGFTSAQIAERLFITSQTVDSHRKNLMSKFSVNKSVNLLHKAKDLGLLHD